MAREIAEMMQRPGSGMRDWAEARPWAVDAVLASVVTLVSLPPLWQLDEATLATGFSGPTPLTIGVALGMTAPLAWRRRAPLAVLAVIAAAYVAAAALAVPGLPLGLLIGVYTLTAYAPRRAAGWGMVAVAVSTAASLWLVGDLGSLVPNLLVLAATGLFGDWQRLQRARARELLRREEQLRRARQELTRLAVERERQRIAAELRDVLAHGVAAMITQARAARRLAFLDVDRAVGPTRAIEETGRAALLELRRLVGLLRDESDEAPTPRTDPPTPLTDPPTPPADPPTPPADPPTPPADPPTPPARDAGTGHRHVAAVPGPPRLDRWRRRLAETSPFVRDLALVVLLVTAESSLQLVTGVPGPVSMALVVGPACMLLLRRRFPQTVLAVALAGTVAIVLLDIPTVFNVVLVAIYTVASRCSRHVRIAWLVISSLVAGWLLLPEGVGYLAGQLLFVGGAWLLGDRQRMSRRYQRELEERTEQLEEAQHRAVAMEVAFERTRIARDLHDVVGASVGVMLILAGGARRTLPRDPQRADRALEQVVACGQQSLAHLRDVLPATEDEGGGLAPQPGLDELPDLVADLELTGLHVDLRVDGEPDAVPAGVALSAYRIVQEALTNVLKHAGTDQAVVRLSHGGTVQVEITDDGPDGRTTHPRSHDLEVPGGHGLIGMAERVRLVGGELEVGPRPGGGYRVMARLPATSPDGADDAAPALAGR